MTAPYTPQQNGLAERTNRTVLGLVRSMLHSSSLPSRLWGECSSFAVHILNTVTINKATGKSPFETIYNRKPQLNNLHPFGSKCFLYNSNPTRQKLDVRGIPVYLVGIESLIDRYRVFDPQTNSIKRSKNVKFLKPALIQNRGSESSAETVRKREINEPATTTRNDDTTTATTAARSRKDKAAEPSATDAQREAVDEPTTERERERAREADGPRTTTDSEDEADRSRSQEHLTAAPENVRHHPDGDAHGYSSAEEEEDRTNPNAHRQLRDRAKLQRPDRYEAFVVEPTTVEQALNSPEADEWKQAMKEELEAMSSNKVWKLEKLPPNKKAIKNRWIFKIKRNQHGEIERFKARLVIKGYTQVPGIDFTETFAPVTRFETLRIVLAIAAAKRLTLEQLDVTTAFLSAELYEDIYMEQPHGFNDNSGLHCKLLKSLYGLRQSSRQFHIKFSNVLLNLGLVQSKVDNCLFYRIDGNDLTMLVIYVDDAIIASSNKQIINDLKSGIQKELKIKTKPLSFFLGIEILIDENHNISMNQTKHINEILERFQLSSCKPASTPIDGSLYENGGIAEDLPYRSLIGSLMYVAIATRPDISFAVGFLSRFLENHTKGHWTRALRVLRYLQGTKDRGIVFSGNNTELEKSLEGYTDADYANDPATRRSVSGFVFKFNDGPITWGSTQQKAVTLSTAEAELVSACQGSQSAIWIKQLLNEILGNVTPTIYIDNQSTIELIRNPVYHKRSKHIEVRHYFIREKCADKTLAFEYVPSSDQLADVFTKPFNKTRFALLRDKLGVGITK